MRKWVVFFLLVLASSAVGRLWYIAKDGFSVNRLRLSMKEQIDPMQEVIAPQLKGPFFYLGRGRQCYAFSSEDGKTVLKIPRFDRYELPFFWKGFPDFLTKKKEIFADRQSRLAFTLESFRLAAQELKEQTGVIYLHLHRTKKLPKDCLLLDRLGRSHEVDLNEMAFILQEKAPLMMPEFLNALQRQDTNGAKQVLRAFLDVIEARARLGIFNKDPSFLKNFGLEGQRGIQIDIGSFYKKEGENLYERSMREGVRPLCAWLRETDLALFDWFQEVFDERVQCES